MTRLRRWIRTPFAPVLLVILCAMPLGLRVVLQHASPTWWAAPVTVGLQLPSVGDKAMVVDVARNATSINFRVNTPTARASYLLWHASTPAPADVQSQHTIGRVALYRTLSSQPSRPPDKGPLPDPSADLLAADAALVAAIAAVENAWIPGPAYVRAPDALPPPKEAASWWLVDVLAALTLLAMVTLVRPMVLPLVRGPGRLTAQTLAWLFGGLAAVSAFVVAYVPHAAWHSNDHGLERWADLLAGVPAPQANLASLHGPGYYAVLMPLMEVLSPSLSVFQIHHLIWLVWLLLTFGWLHTLWEGDQTKALVGVLLLATSAPILRLAPTVTLYLPTMACLSLALWWFEHHLRSLHPAWLMAALLPSALAMNARADVIAVVPVFIGLSMLCRRPDWLRTAWRRPGIVLPLLLAPSLVIARVLSVLSSGKDTAAPASLWILGADLRISQLLVLGGLGLLASWPARAALSWVSDRVRPLLGRATAWAGAAVLAGPLGVLAYRSATYPERAPTVTLHPLLDLDHAAWWWFPLVSLGCLSLWRRDSKLLSWAALSLAIMGRLTVPHVDCLSTYVRAGLPLSLPLAVLGGAGAVSAWRTASATAYPRIGQLTLVAIGLSGLPSWTWTTQIHAKQARHALLMDVREALPFGATVVALHPSDPPGADGEWKTTRAHPARHLRPDMRVLSLTEWLADPVPAWFFKNTDCFRPPLAGGSQPTAWLGDGQAHSWRYSHVSLISTHVRLGIDWPVRDGVKQWEHPQCRQAMAYAVEARFEQPVPRVVSGSIYEIAAPHSVMGLFRLDPSAGLNPPMP